MPSTLGITTVKNPLGIIFLQRNLFDSYMAQVEESYFELGVNLIYLKPMF